MTHILELIGVGLIASIPTVLWLIWLEFRGIRKELRDRAVGEALKSRGSLY